MAKKNYPASYGLEFIGGGPQITKEDTAFFSKYFQAQKEKNKKKKQRRKITSKRKRDLV